MLDCLGTAVTVDGLSRFLSLKVHDDAPKAAGAVAGVGQRRYIGGGERLEKLPAVAVRGRGGRGSKSTLANCGGGGRRGILGRRGRPARGRWRYNAIFALYCYSARRCEGAPGASMAPCARRPKPPSVRGKPKPKAL